MIFFGCGVQTKQIDVFHTFDLFNQISILLTIVPSSKATISQHFY